jgi:Domain of unknown function (DUF1990)
MDDVRAPWPRLLLRWVVGMALVSWRYLWLTTPLHRWERHDHQAYRPPPVSGDVRTDRLQPWTAGVGDLYHRHFRVRIRAAQEDAAGLMTALIEDFGRFLPSEVVHLHEGEAAGRALRVNDEVVVDMPGPWNGPVRVAAVEPRRLLLATLTGHLEAGQVEFRAYDEPSHVVFEVETWARSSSRLVHLLYSKLGLAKEIQLNMWLRVCQAAARIARGRVDGGVEIGTVVTPAGAGAPSGSRGGG